jgi:hypothetical protein
VREHLGGPADKNLYHPDRGGPAYDAWNPFTKAFVDAKDSVDDWFTNRIASSAVRFRDKSILDEAWRQVRYAGPYRVEWWTNRVEAELFLKNFFRERDIPIRVIRWP